MLYIRRAQRYITQFRLKESMVTVDQLMKFSLLKLGLNVGTFAIVYSFHIAFSLYVIIHPSDCLFKHNEVRMLIMYFAVRNIALLRIIIDSIVTFSIDVQVLHMYRSITTVSIVFRKKCTPLRTRSVHPNIG